MSLHLHDAAGLLGISMILVAYFLLQDGRVRGDALSYQLMNAFGALAVLVSLIFAFNLSAFVLESVWLAVSIYGIARTRRRGR